MRLRTHLIFAFAPVALAATLRAAVPVAWTNAPWMAPHLIGPFPHGSTIEFAVTLRGYTEPPIAAGADLRLWFQTNGMGKAWRSAPASLDGNVITSTFGPAQDTGADRVSLFFGAPSNVFAAAVLRLSHAPGYTPNALPLPVEMLDFAATAYTNAPWLTEVQVDARIQELAPPVSLAPATNYTDEAIMVQHGELVDGLITVGRAEFAGNAGNAYSADIAERLRDGITGEIYSPADFALRADFTNNVCNIVTNEVETGEFGPWIFSRPGEFAIEETYYDDIGAGEHWEYVLYENGHAIGSDGSDDRMTEIDWSEYSQGLVSTRRRITRNALGLARVADMPSTNGMVSAAVATNVVRRVVYAVADYAWDGDVCWRRELRQGGFIEYVAVTNIDVRLPENWEALDALERERREP